MPDADPSSGPIALAPLPAPAPSPWLQRIAHPRAARPSANPAALIPLFYAALLYLAGIVAARYFYFRPSWLLLGLFPLALVAVLAIRRAPRLVWLPLATVWLVLGLWSAETEPAPAPNPAVAQISDGLLRTVEGAVLDAGPLRLRNRNEDALEDQEPGAPSESPGDHTQQLDLQLAAAEVVTDASDSLVPVAIAANARIRLSIQWPAGSAPQEIACGQRLRAVVRILPADTFLDPGVWNRAESLESQQITALARVNPAKRDSGQPRLALLGNPGRSAQCALNRWRDQAAAHLQALPAITHSLPGPLRATPEDAAMLTALLTGDRTYLTRNLRTGFERTGSFHLVVVSGLHLAILAGLVFALCRRVRLPRLPSTALTLALTLGYALLTGFAIPAQRAFWMIALYLLGRLLYRDRSPLNVIGFATLCLAAASPRSIFDSSFQMTLLAVASIAGIAAPLLAGSLHARIRATQNLSLISLDSKLPPIIAQFRVTLRLIARHLAPATSSGIAWRILPFVLRAILRLGELLFVTLTVELALALPMALYFHRITVYALPINLCILPLLVILVPAAMLLLVALAVGPVLGILPAAVCVSILHLSLFLIRRLGALWLGDFRIPGPTALQIAVALLLFVAALQLARAPFARRSAWQRGLAFAALLSMAVTALWPRSIDHPANALLFEAIDVGQGDSLLLITPDGKTLLVDGGGLGFYGSTTHARFDFDVGEEVVSAVLWSRGIRRLDAVALTHAHHDHMGGLPAILRNFRPRELWVGNNPPVPAYESLLQEARTLGVRVRAFHAVDNLPLGAADIRVLAPAAVYLPGPQPLNNDSLVLQARYKETSVLLAGDAESPEEQFLLTEPGLRSTLLKVGHHGSLTSTRPAFLAAVSPAWAVISCGRRNRFGHPRMEILSELQAAHVRTFRTDVDGATCFLLDGQSVTAQSLCGLRPDQPD